MIAVGTFPYQDDEVDLEQVPRVGDGMLVIDPESRIQYASPNALSTLHRVGVLGNVAGRRLEDIGIRHPAIKDASERFRALVVEIERNDTAVQLMGMPISERDSFQGSLLLLRDITELRMRDRLLVSKDATLSLIHISEPTRPY